MLKMVIFTFILAITLSILFTPETDVDYSDPADNIPQISTVQIERAEQLRSESERLLDRVHEQHDRQAVHNLSRTYTFSDFNLLTPSGLSAESLDELTKNTELSGLGTAYMEAERETGINALFLLALSIHESEWGRSRFARERNNIFGFQAFTHNPANAAYFESKEGSIMKVARHLKDNYLSPDGEHFNGYTVRDVNRAYAADPGWSNSITQIMGRLSDRLEEEFSM